MSDDAGLVGYLVDRIAAKLPYTSGIASVRFEDDEVAQTTQATLVNLSRTSVHVVLESLLDLLESISRPYSSIATHPTHILQSEIYVLGLASACCASNWAAFERKVLEPLNEIVVSRLFEQFKILLEPIPDNYVLPAQTLLGQTSLSNVTIPRKIKQSGDSELGIVSSYGPEEGSSQLVELEGHIKGIVEFITASSWDTSFSYIRNVIHKIRSSTGDGHQEVSKATDFEKGSLVILRLLSFCWVDGHKLGLLVQELCSSYLHFRGPYQNTVAAAMPLLIIRWIDRCPEEFVTLHRLHKRLDGGADTLFDMTQTATESGKRRATLHPLQITLLFLIPDIFEVASNLRESKGSNVIKKVSFLDGLRKALRNGNEQAGYCLVSLLRVARHFDIETDSALVSFAMDVQDEVRDAIFRTSLMSSSTPPWDQNMITAALVCLSYLNLDGCVDTLYGECVAEAAPSSFKLAMIQACCYFAQQPNAAKYRGLFQQALPFVKTQMKKELLAFHDCGTKVAPTASVIICNILKYLSVSLDPIIHELSNSESGLFEVLLHCAVSRDASIQQHASITMENLLSSFSVFLRERENSHRLITHELLESFWSHSSAVLLLLCDQVLLNGDTSPLADVESYLKSRLNALQRFPALCHIPHGMEDATLSSSKLETVILVSLCAPDIEDCQRAISCLRHFVEECKWISKHDESAKACSSIIRNAGVYREISSPFFRVTGLAAFQKRTRNLLRRIQFPTPGILNAWETAFASWTKLSKEVSVMPADIMDGKILHEWRNMAGFLAAMSGVCTADQAVLLEEPSLTDLRWIDQISSGEDEEVHLIRYLRLGVRLLSCTNIKVRESMRELLTHDVPSSVYQPLFKVLEAQVQNLLADTLAPSSSVSQDAEIVFAEQAALLLKDMVEELGSPYDLAYSSVHLVALTLNFAKFIGAKVDSVLSMRVKIRICQLCEAVTSRKEHLNVRDDVLIRNQLLDNIFSWINRGGFSHVEIERTNGRIEETDRLQRDLDTACLRALADLTFRLPLQPPDIQYDAGMSAKKSELFQNYFNRFLDLLNQDPSTPEQSSAEKLRAQNGFETRTNSELAISILSNLLSANIDVGLKHSLNLGYHENVEIRTAFIKVLYNILSQGTEFSNLSDSALSEKYEELLDLLTKDLSLAVSMSSICPGSEIDELTMSLLIVFEQRGRTFELLEALIKEEIEQTENAAEILRRTCVATKMLSLYGKWKGFGYLRSTLHTILERLMMTSQELDLELDPARVSTAEELQENAVQLQIVAKVFMDDICSSAPNIPSSFRKICNIIHSSVLPRFPDAKYTAVGAFVFLRFFCPAIVAPEAEGLVETAPTKEMRRGLLLIAKIIQNLANNVLFGTKEPYMFPLNSFLVKNISVVTSFLREISTPPDNLEVTVSKETFDLGSCVSFHNFLYDHWDHLRQTNVARERRDCVRFQKNSTRNSNHSGVFEPLRNLIANLGPPPFAVSWNRPHISSNGPPMYSRFQNFMLRNAFRGTESFLTSRAIYDGAETADGLSIVNIILRYGETEGMDHETLLYCFLKISSRLWHEPFGILVDATCYTGKNEPRDDFFRMLDLLAPHELRQNLARIYIYNMNSAFKRCLRRMLRVTTKNENSAFHPNNVEYALYSNFQELQTCFQRDTLKLPKDTLSSISDIRFMFRMIRLSKSKGKVEVIIKVGTHFVQVTTKKKQEILSGLRLSTTVNDIFRLDDIDEAPAVIQNEDDSTFGLRADGGKIVMCFTSPQKADVLQALRSAKARCGKDVRPHKPLGRLIRPQDVPGTLLNLSFMNLSSSNHKLRLSSYNLLGALCRAFKFKTATRLVCSLDLSIPMDPARFIVNISKELAASEPQLTSDFLSEFFVSWDTFPEEQKAVCLAYMAPWLTGLRRNVLASEADGEKGREKVATILRKFIELIVLDEALSYALEQLVWPTLANDEVLLDIFLDELIKTIMNFNVQQEVIDGICATVANIGTVTIRAKFLSRLRKALNRSSLRPTKSLPENAVWPEMCIMLQICLSLSFDSGIQAQLFLPEVFHIITMLVNTGNQGIRLQVHRFLMNTVHAVCTSFIMDDAKFTKLRASLDLLAQPAGGLFYSSSSLHRDGTAASLVGDTGSALLATENLVSILFDICTVAAPSVDAANAWRSRWMSLVASTAFQNNPAVQPRAFAVMGYLAREEVDDDLLYQVLVALRNSISQFGEDGNSEMLISIITSLSRMMANLPSASRYGLQLFWLAMSLVRLVPESLFNCTAQFLEALLINIGSVGGVRGTNMIPMLLQSRNQLDEAVEPLDRAYGIHFDEENFHFAVCACLVRGLTEPTTRLSAVRVLWSFLEMASPPLELSIKMIHSLVDSPYLVLILARCGDQNDFKDNMWQAGINADGITSLLNENGRRHADIMEDRDLLLMSAIELVDFQYLEDAVQARMLCWLNELALSRQGVFTYLCGLMPSILNDVIMHGQDSAALEAAHTLVRTLTSEGEYASAMSTTEPLAEALEEMGFGGLWKTSFQEQVPYESKDCLELTEKLIELIVI